MRICETSQGICFAYLYRGSPAIKGATNETFGRKNRFYQVLAESVKESDEQRLASFRFHLSLAIIPSWVDAKRAIPLSPPRKILLLAPLSACPGPEPTTGESNNLSGKKKRPYLRQKT
jgi:hypothetical protein